MTSAELTQWQAYEQVAGPLGPERHDALAALISFYGLKAAGVKKVKLPDLMPRWDRPKAQPWQSIKNALMALTKAGGGEIVHKDDD